MRTPAFFSLEAERPAPPKMQEQVQSLERSLAQATSEREAAMAAADEAVIGRDGFWKAELAAKVCVGVGVGMCVGVCVGDVAKGAFWGAGGRV